MGRNDIGFVIAGGLHFDQHLVRQADDSRTGLADKAFTDTDFIGTIGFGNADALVLDDHEVIASSVWIGMTSVPWWPDKGTSL